jgi:hypothetical protein
VTPALRSPKENQMTNDTKPATSDIVFRNGRFRLTAVTVLCAHRGDGGRLDCTAPGHFRLDGPGVPDGEESMYCFDHGQAALRRLGESDGKS